MQDSNISWTDDTINPWWGCTKISEGCAHCYAETLDARLYPTIRNAGRLDGARTVSASHWGNEAPRRLRVEAALGELARSFNTARKQRRVRRVFVASMADLFEDRPDLEAPRLAFLEGARKVRERHIQTWGYGEAGDVRLLLLTKRPDVMARWALRHGWAHWWWAGTTAENGTRWAERRDHLARVPAGVRFVSVEPMLSAVCIEKQHAHWAIFGGESGTRHRPLDLAALVGSVNFARSEGVAVWVKQDSGLKAGQQGRIPDHIFTQDLPMDKA
jgi:protein gp37